MSYPPTPDPLSAPSSRAGPATRVSHHSGNSTSSSSDHGSISPGPFSSADAYAPVHSSSSAPSGHRSNDSEVMNPLGGGQRSASPLNGRSESDAMLRPSSQLPGPRRLSSQPPLNPPPTFNEELGSYAQPRNASSSTFAPSFLGATDPYARYSTHSDAAGSRAGSNMNLSIDDGDSQRQLYSGATSQAMGGRRSSALGYGSYQDKEEDEEEGAAGIGGFEGKGGSRRLTRGGSRRAQKEGRWASMSSRAKKFLIAGLILVALLIAVAVAIPTAILKKSNLSAGASDNVGAASTSGQAGATPTSNGAGGSKATPPAVADPKTAATGRDGSVVFAADGSSFVYNNTFGGFWNAIPFNDSAQAQADVPPLNQPWNYDTNLINGVNLGGWLVIEPFIVPSLFEPFSPSTISPTGTYGAVDEWTLSVALGANLATTIENHYATFITEKDFAEIAAAGLNWVRLPVGYWMVETYDGEPFLALVSWKYFLLAITWARKYGLRINLDLHAVPGSQNGYNHSSKLGTINFLNGVMGVANAQRTLNYIRTLAEFISQPQYKNVVPMFSIINEPFVGTIGIDVIRHFYLETYNMIRDIGGTGTGNGPFIVLHDGFVQQGIPVSRGGWMGFLPGSDRVSLDSHPYLCFGPPNNDGLAFQATKPCTFWAAQFNTSTAQFGLSMGGEWSLAINDCGKWINNVGVGSRYDGTYYAPGNTQAPAFDSVGSCDSWNDWENYTDARKAGLKLLAQTHHDALRHWFFWTWKTGVSPALGKVANPLWNYQLGLQQGYMPASPRNVPGTCASVVAANGASMSVFPAPSLLPWMTGGAGAGVQQNAAQVAAYTAFPPASIGVGATPVAFLPTYTATGSIITMQASAPTSYPAGYSSVTGAGNGWYAAGDTALFATPVAGCVYPNAWSGVGAPVPTAVCGGAGRARAVTPTSAPIPAVAAA